MTAYELSELKITIREKTDRLHKMCETDGDTVTLTKYQINSYILSVFSECLDAVDDALKAKG